MAIAASSATAAAAATTTAREHDAGTTTPKWQQPPPSQEQPQSPTAAGFACPLCLSLLVRPVTLECGSSLCESCVAQALHHAWTVRGPSSSSLGLM